MGNESYSLLEQGHEVLFAYEEAIGFMYGTTVLDKDGISVGAVIAELGGYLYNKDMTFTDLLEDIYIKYGRYMSSNSYYICHSTDIINDLFDSLRKDRKVGVATMYMLLLIHFLFCYFQYPQTCGNNKVISVCDLTVGYDSREPPDYKPVC